MVITTRVAEANMHRILVDGGSSADILFMSSFDQMQIPHSRLTKAEQPLKGFNGDLLEALGQIELLVCFSWVTRAHMKAVIFDVVNLPYA
ncbi:hypothetical protein E2562_029995 [Oryza meyeriana var. granulata]|uniref:Peptidase A2 domain-containing protein n=1 Tax=Oryza meyeriana var. granulata TaxID=110450 RepID=A0A6G1ERD0_9ORYZ|nr:hypothetical protein E2562_029995 [Oryza meyeriana var. granulata]